MDASKIRRRGVLAVAATLILVVGILATGSNASPPDSTSGRAVTPVDGTVEAALTNAEADIPTLYAGATYHREDDHYTVYGPASTMGDLKAYFRARVTPSAFDTIEFVGVERSLDELYAIQQEIGREIPWFERQGIELARAAIRKELGMIEIGLFHYTADAERLILEHFGADRVTVSPQDSERFFDG